METKKVCEIVVEGGRKRVPLPRRCINIMGLCLRHLGRAERDFLGLAHGTVREFTEPTSADGRKFETNTVLRILFAIGAKPEQLAALGIQTDLANSLRTKMGAVIRHYEVEGYEPDGEFATQVFGNNENEDWLRILGDAEQLIPEASDEADDLFHAKVVSSPIKFAILDLISEGKIVAGLPISIADLRKEIRARKKVVVDLFEIELALQCLVDKRLMDRRNSSYRLNRLDESTWEELTELRKAIECTNIGRLVRDADRCGEVVHEAKTWLTEMETAVEDNDVSGFVRADVRFHLQLTSKSDFAHRALSGLVTFLRLAAPRFASNASMEQLLEDHRNIYSCIADAANHNRPNRLELEETAKQLMAQHLENSCDLFCQAELT